MQPTPLQTGNFGLVPPYPGRFRPVDHGDLLDLTLSWFRKHATEVLQADAAYSPKGSEMMARFLIRGMAPPLKHGEYSCWLYNCNDRYRRSRLYFGVWLPDDEVDLVLRRVSLPKKTLKLTFNTGIASELHNCKYAWELFPKRLAELDTWEVDDQERRVFLFRCGERELIPWSRVGRVNEQFVKSKTRTLRELLILLAGQVRRGPVMKWPWAVWRAYIGANSMRRNVNTYRKRKAT